MTAEDSTTLPNEIALDEVAREEIRLHDIEGHGLDLEERQALRRVAGIRTDIEDVTEVEYRALRLERVVLVGVWTEGSAEDAENSMVELQALAETAGAEVLEGLIQRRQ